MSNYTDELKASRGESAGGFRQLWDESASFGGPIRRDRVWFFYAQRYRGNDVIGTDAHFEEEPEHFVSTRTFSRPLHGGGWDLDNQVRVTLQVTPRDEVSGFFDNQQVQLSGDHPTPTQSGESGTPGDVPAHLHGVR